MSLKFFIVNFLLCVNLTITLAQIDDEKCEAQLRHFSESLATREAWAVERK